MTAAYWVARVGSTAVFSSAGGFEVIGREKRVESGPAIIAANHASFLDPPAVACAYDREVAFLARSTLFKGLGAWIFPKLNAFPIDREQADLKSMKTILRKLKDGHRVLMFPEGTRTHDGHLQTAKAGLGLLVAKSGVPVQPVRIFGTYESWPRGGKYRAAPVTVVIGDPVRFSASDLRESSRESYQRIADQIMAAIGELTLRGAAAPAS